VQFPRTQVNPSWHWQRPSMLFFLLGLFDCLLPLKLLLLLLLLVAVELVIFMLLMFAVEMVVFSELMLLVPKEREIKL
jgi:hypothetical protein